GVLCRFTAFVAVDERVVNEGGRVHRVTQPVEVPQGWGMPSVARVAGPMGAMMPAAAPMRRERAGRHLTSPSVHAEQVVLSAGAADLGSAECMPSQAVMDVNGIPPV